MATAATTGSKAEAKEEDAKETNKVIPLATQPVEHVQKNTTEDDAMMQFVTEHYGAERWSAQHPDTIYRFVRGYAHEKERKKATLERLDEFFVCAIRM